jgi:hypothetical protein
MLRRSLALFVVFLGPAYAVLLGLSPLTHRTNAKLYGSTRPLASKLDLARMLSRLPLTFERNRGQANPSADFLARTQNFALFLTPTEAVLSPGITNFRQESASRGGQPAAVRMQFLHANVAATIEGQDESGAISNYFIGNDPKKWHSRIPRYKAVRVRDLYSGIDLLYYGKNTELEHDFVVAPGNDPRVIDFAFAGAEGLAVNDGGDLIVRLKDGELRLKKPKIYQAAEAIQEAITGGYVVRGGNHVGFTIGPYDQRKPLIIDPVLEFSTYFGGNNFDTAESAAVDSNGNIYLVGATGSTDFPLQNPFQSSPNPTTCGTAPNTYLCGTGFVSKFNPTATSLIFSTYFGGSTGTAEQARSVVVDSSGSVYIAGTTTSSDFPTTPGAFSTTYNAGQCSGYTCQEAYVAKFNSSGSTLAYSTYLGSVGDTVVNEPRSLAVDSSGKAYVTGTTTSASFPTTAGAFQTTCILTTSNECEKAFVSVFNQAGSALEYSTYLGGSGGESGSAIAVDSSDSAVVIGYTGSSDFPLVNPLQTMQSQGFFAKLTPDGSGLVFSSYLGGATGYQVSFDSVTLDQNDNIYIGGWTSGTDFPTTPGAYLTTVPASSGGFWGVAVKIDKSGSFLAYSTYLAAGPSAGTYPDTEVLDIAVDGLGQAYLTGFTSMVGFPQVNTILPNYPGPCSNPGAFGCYHGFVSVFNAQGNSLVFSTYLGGSGTDFPGALAVDQSQSIYIAGETNSSDFPVANAYQPTYNGGTCVNVPCFDAFLTKLQPPALSAAPVSLTFLPQNVGSSSSPQSVTITNSFSQEVQVLSISVPANFPETDTCSSGVPGGATCVVNVSFSPTATGQQSGNLTITYDGLGGTVVVPLTGTGTQPALQISPTNLQFGSQAIGVASASQNITLTNSGNGQLDFSSITASGDFAQTNTCITDLTAGSTCSISVVFTPQAAGVRNGQVTISYDAAGSPQTVSLTGTGTGPVDTLAPASLQFNPQTVDTISAAQSVTITNNGNSALNISSIGITGDFGQTNDCGSTVAAAANCSISVTFSPTALGARSGTLTVTDNAFGSPHSVSLNGSGVSFSLGASATGSTSVTMTAGNTAVFNLQAQGLAGFSGPVALTANCGSVPKSSSCSLSVSTLQITGPTPSPFLLSVGTTADAQLLPFYPNGRIPSGREKFLLVVTALGLLFVLFSISDRLKERKQARFGIAFGIGFALLCFSLSSCSSGGSGGTTGNTGTAPGTYTVTVTGSSQGASQTQDLMLIVQ